MSPLEPNHHTYLDIVASLFPDTVAAAVWNDDDDIPGLYPVEELAVLRGVEKRYVEFAKGRACARLALGKLGVPSVPIPVGPDRAPRWPNGVVGSITHCDKTVAAVAARRDHVASLGIDAESNERLSPELGGMVCTAAELEWISETEPPAFGDWQKVLFSAKESVHKAIYPLCHEVLDFVDVEVTVDSDWAGFIVQPARELPSIVPDLSRLRGRFAMTREAVFTGAVMDHGR